jgi:CAAX protease family protein
MAFINRHRIAVFFVLAYALAWGATPWNGFFARGVLMAALIVVTLTEGLSRLKAPAWNASPTATPSHS